jgi:hypothetical protein
MPYSAGQGFVTGTGNGSSSTDFGTMSDDLILTLWSSKLHMETKRELWFTDRGMTKQETGDESVYTRNSSAPVIIKDEMGVGRGQRIRLALRKQLTSGLPAYSSANAGDHSAINRWTAVAAETGYIHPKHFSVGTTGTAATEGSLVDAEENMELYDLSCTVEMMKHAVAFSAPEIQNMRTSFNMEDEAAVALRDWLVAQKEESILDSFYFGNPAHIIRGGTDGTAAAPVTHPNHVLAGDATASATGYSADLVSDDKLDGAALRKIYKECRQKNINPISVGGQDVYVVLANVRCMQDLMADNTSARTGVLEVMNRAGTGSDNPIISRSEVYYSGLCVHEYNRVRGANLAGTTAADGTGDPGTESEHIHNIVLGADALVEANATEPRLVRRKEDRYEDVYGIGIKQVYGGTRADWTSVGGTVMNQSSLQFTAWGA